MKGFLLLPITLLLLCLNSFATTYYVSVNTGNDNNPGTTAAAPLKTFNAAMNKSAPGDVINIMAGTYNYMNQGLGLSSSIIWIYPQNSGAPGNPITYQVNPGDEGQVILQNYGGWSAIHVDGADHLIFDGFKIVGQAAFYAHTDLENEYYNIRNTGIPHTSRNSGTGFTIQAQYGSNPKDPAVNVIVRNCDISQTTGGGIALYEAAKTIIENNTIYNCGKYTVWGGSGLSSIYTRDCESNNPLTPCSSFDTPADDAYNLIFRGNFIYDNDNLYECKCDNYNSITDGNGIILDLNNPSGGGYQHQGKVLIENNVVFNNGGKGIHAFHTDRVDIINNTLYNNATRPNQWGACDISTYDSDNIKIYNNTAKTSGSLPSMHFYISNNVQVYNNVHSNYINTNGVAISSGNNLQQDPLYQNVSSSDFQLQTTSPAIDHGNNNYPIANTDFGGNNRINGNNVDAGAIESGSTTPSCPISAGTNATIAICSNAGTIDLFTNLGGNPTPGGAWTDDNSSGGLTGASFDPSGLIGSYNFTYLIIDVLCTKTAIVTVNVSNCGPAAPICNTATTPTIDGNPEAPVWSTLATTNANNLLIQKEVCTGTGSSLDVWDTAWEMPLRVASMNEVNTYFDHLQSKGYYGVVLSYLNHWQGGINETDFNGNLGASYDGTNLNLNAAHANLFEDYLDAAQARGLKVGVVAAWGVYYASDKYTPIYVNTSNAYNWGYQLGTRFGNHPALEMWVMGGDNFDVPAEPCAVWGNMVNGIKAAGSTAPKIAYHTAATPTGRLHCINESWNEIQLAQTGHCQEAYLTEIHLTEVNNATTNEVWAGELRYEDIDPSAWGGSCGSAATNAAAVLEDVQAAVAANVDAMLYGHVERFQWGNGDVGSTGLGFTSVQSSFNAPGENAMFNYLGGGATNCNPIVPTPVDLSVEFQLTWDNTNLYIYAAVTDSSLVNNSDTDVWEDDGIEVYLDGGNEKGTAYDGNDHHLLFRYNDATIHHLSAGATNPTGITASQGSIPGGYSKEMAIPWAFLGVTPANGTQIGLDVHVNDDDDGGARDQKLATYATVDEAWNNPSLFGSYQLQATCAVCPTAGTTCDDGDPNTQSDQEDGNCNCIGTPIITGTVVCEVTTPPTLDGMGTEWSQTSYPLTNNLNGVTNSAIDLSGDFQVSWDNNYLYVYGSITDDVLMNDSPGAPYDDDTFEVYIDGGNEKATTYDANDHQLMFRVNDPDIAYWSAQQTNPAGVDFSRTIVPGGYEIEVRVSWTFIGVTPSPAMEIGLDVHVVDDDDGAGSDKKLSWYSTTDQAWNNPSLFNTVTLSNQCAMERLVDCTPALLLEGPYSGNSGLMNNKLQQTNLLPTGQPYTGAPWNYQGQEGDGWTAADYPAGTVDWVLVSLRTSPMAEDQIARFSAVLLEDGTIQPAAPVQISTAINSVYIVVEHRNHLPAMSPSPVDILNNTITYDFRNGNSYTGTNGFGQKEINGSWFLYAGNVDQTNPSGYEVTGSDKAFWEDMNGNFSVYEPTDFNLDSDVNGVDKVLWNYNNGISSSVPK